MQRVTPLQVHRQEMWALGDRADQMQLSAVEIEEEAVDFTTHSLFGVTSIGACTGEMRPLYRRSGPTLRRILAQAPVINEERIGSAGDEEEAEEEQDERQEGHASAADGDEEDDEEGEEQDEVSRTGAHLV